VGIIGGSKEYTGAPYYSGIAALKAGADIAHVYTTEDASGPIKGYSPELIVHPTIHNREEMKNSMGGAVTSMIIGPGLGRYENEKDNLLHILEKLGDTDIQLTMDADILWYMSDSYHRHCFSSMITNSFRKKPILTPNGMEFKRILQQTKYDMQA